MRADEFLEPSDEEVLGYSSGEDDDDDDMEVASDDDAELKDSKHKQNVQEEDDAGGWGPSKKDYYNADAIETEQDGQFCFDVEIRLPIIGLIVAYKGKLKAR